MAGQLASGGELDVGATRQLKPGAHLVRRWRGTVYVVQVLEAGFSYDQRAYSSLTQIAREITGAAWSGPRFFGLKQREKAA